MMQLKQLVACKRGCPGPVPTLWRLISFASIPAQVSIRVIELPRRWQWQYTVQNDLTRFIMAI